MYSILLLFLLLMGFQIHQFKKKIGKYLCKINIDDVKCSIYTKSEILDKVLIKNIIEDVEILLSKKLNRNATYFNRNELRGMGIILNINIPVSSSTAKIKNILGCDKRIIEIDMECIDKSVKCKEELFNLLFHECLHIFIETKYYVLDKNHKSIVWKDIR